MADENKYSSWIELLKTVTSIKVLLKKLNVTPQTEGRFWQDLLALLQSEEAPFDWGTDQTIATKVFGYITENADLSDGSKTDLETGEVTYISNLYATIQQLIDQQTDSFWNESLSQLIKVFLEEFSGEPKTLIDNPDGHEITTETLLMSDAGNNFPEPFLGEDYVKPWYNIDNENYDDVRKRDEVIHVLENWRKLQYTKKPDNDEEPYYSEIAPIRLLMPQYGRRVEVEDLDRNFWVIAQFISAISSYIVGHNSPFPTMFKGLLREVSEIWENVLYLWLEYAAITAKDGGRLNVIVIPITPRDNEHGRKFDGIDESDWYTYEEKDGYLSIVRQPNFDINIINNINYLQAQYTNQKICVVPFIRLENYKHNYYTAEWYPGIYICENGVWSVKRLYEVPEDAYNPTHGVYPTFNREVVISPKYDMGYKVLSSPDKRFSPQIYASKQDANECIYYAGPFSKTCLINAEKKRFLLYGVLRSIVDIDSSIENDTVKINDFTLSVYDGAEQLCSENIQETVTPIGQYKVWLDEPYGIFLKYEPIKAWETDIQEVRCVEPTPNKIGYYMGEVASWKEKTISEKTSDNLFNSISYVIKVGSYLRATDTYGNEQIQTFETALMSDGNHTLMRGNLTERTGAGNLLKFYLNDWTSYLPNNDKIGEGNAPDRMSCFSTIPTAKSCEEVTESFLAEQGLIAVKNYLKKTGQLDQPCYIATAIGLTPWEVTGTGPNSNLNYWDAGALCHIYHYIPSIASLEYSPTDLKNNGYTTAYEAAGVFNIMEGVGENERIKESGIIYEGDLEVGKIISCNLIHKYDSFYDSWGMDTSNVFIAPQWRQFQIVCDVDEEGGESEDKEKCIRVISNPGQEDEYIDYDVTFSKTFEGTVSYYDNRWAEVNNVDTFNDGAKVGIAPIKINENGYSQIDVGRIAAATAADVPIEDRANVATDNNNTGLIPPNNIDFMNMKKDAGITEAMLFPGASRGNWIYI